MDESGLLFAFCLLCALRARPCGGCARIFNVRNGPCVNIGSGMTCITSVEILQVDLPPPVPRSDAIQSFVMQETPIVRLQMDDGGAATGYSYTIGTGGSSVVALPKDHLAPRLIGRDPSCIEAIWHDLMFATHATTVAKSRCRPPRLRRRGWNTFHNSMRWCRAASSSKPAWRWHPIHRGSASCGVKTSSTGELGRGI